MNELKSWFEKEYPKGTFTPPKGEGDGRYAEFYVAPIIANGHQFDFKLFTDKDSRHKFCLLRILLSRLVQ